MRVLVIGGGGREHALCWALSRDPDVEAISCAPGNPGIAQLAELRPLTDPVEVATAAAADLVVIGPEAPLVAGVADELRAAGFDVFGPSAAAAQLEGSKAFAKQVMAAAGVPTAAHHTCTTPDEVAAALDATGAPYVVKHDELAAGKGVVVTDDRDEAMRHAAGHTVVVEEFLDGPEVSLFCLTDGSAVVPLIPAQDFKRINDNDEGPNTGGMGAYTPLPWLPPETVTEIVDDVVKPVAAEMVRRGVPFSGLLYAGLAIGQAGPAVVEFNCRFGDPETQAVLALLDSPLGALLHATATGTLAQAQPPVWKDGAAITVVLAAENYPGRPRTGDVISGTESAPASEGSANAEVLHAGTALRADGALLSAGGRVLNVVATGGDLTEARTNAYARIAGIKLPGSHFRTDIGLAAVEDRISLPTRV